MNFNPQKIEEELISWVQDWFDKNGPTSPAVIGISGGKDSLVCAAILTKALGPKRVIGVMMPNGEQRDIDDSKRVCNLLGIRSTTVNIEKAYTGIFDEINIGKDLNVPAFTTNTPARIRMTVLYGVAAAVNGRVCCTCNLSEDYCGYSTKWGDNCGDFSPISNLTVTEVKALGDYMKLPKELVHKTPSDGMSGMSDESKLGFSYDDLDKVIRNLGEVSDSVRAKIEKIHNNPNVAKKIVIKKEDTFIPEF